MFKRINEQVAKEKLNNPQSVLLDMRDSESYSEGHLDGAIHLTQESIVEVMTNTAKDAPVLVMCYHGNGSQNVAAYLAQQGFTDVYSIDGGYEGWSDK